MINKVDLDKLLKSKKISQRTYDKVVIAKQIIEHKYNLKNIKNAEMNIVFSKIDLLNITPSLKEQIKQEIHSQESSKFRKLREKQSIRDYISLAIIGRGAFGEVHVCREKKTGQIVAVKKIRKEVLKMKNQVIHVRNEQLFMSKVKSPWIVELKASFQENEFLYLVMEYLPGGDFMNLLIKKDILPEDEAKFYTAELILAIENIHKLDCIHRDIKPDNILIDKNGHIKLSDFGLAKVSDKIYNDDINDNINDNSNYENIGHQKNYSCVGTAYYVAPEVLKKNGYGPEVDWWSVGVIFFEMLIGYAPFCSKETSDVCHKVLNWKKYLKIPSKKKISKEAEDLIYKLINNPNTRLGIGGADEIKQHPFFGNIDWKNIRNIKAPFIPKLKNEYDTSYFEILKEQEPFYPPSLSNKKFKRKDIEFMGYTYKEGDFNDITPEIEFLNSIEGVKYINHDKEKSDANSLDISSNISNNSNNNSSEKIRERMKSNGIKKNDNNNINVHLEKEINTDNNEYNKILMTKKIFGSKGKYNKYNKIDILDKNNNNNIVLNKTSYITKQNNILHTIGYDKSPQNNHINSINIKKFKKNINILISVNNSNNNNGNNSPSITNYFEEKNNNIKMNKIIKTEPNTIIKNNNVIHNFLEYQNKYNINNNNTKLNVIQLPSKKITREKIKKKILLKEEKDKGRINCHLNIINSNKNKYNFTKNQALADLKKEKYIHNRISPQPNRDIIFKKFFSFKSKSKKKNNNSTNKEVNKIISPKRAINQNAFKKIYIGSNSARSIFIKKYIQNKFSNSFNNISNESYTFNTQNEKTSYIYKKKL